MCEPANTIKMQYISPQCQYFVIRKKRLCRMTVKPGKNYCGEHEPQPKTDQGQDDTRIPCPNDPKHTCYVSKLEKHLSICNARQQEQPSYIVHNVNAPAATEDCPRLPLAKLPLRRILQVIDKVNMLYDTYLKDKIATLPEYPIHSAVAQEFNEAGRTESSLRHLRQASTLLHVVEEEQLVQNNTAYVELGAGKGQLSYYAWHAWCRASDSRVLLVDRASLRHKRDNKLRDTRPTTHNTDTTTHNLADGETPTTHNNIHTTQILADGETPTTYNNTHTTQNLADTETPTTYNNTHTTQSLSDGETPTTRNTHTTQNLTDGETSTTHNNTHTTTHNLADVDVALTDKLNVHNEGAITVHGIGSKDIMNAAKYGINTETHNINHQQRNISTDNGPTDINTYPNDAKTNESNEKINEGACDSNVQRIRADLAHLVLGRVPAVRACGGVVGIAKHLCGVATDLALRCVTSEEVHAKVRGVVLASCCHHRCERTAYPATDALQKLGIDADDFNALLGVVSWATCGDGRSRDRRNQHSSAGNIIIESNAVDNPAPNDYNIPEESKENDNPTETNSECEELGTKNLGLSQQEREVVGRRAKALLDWGRVLYLRGRGFDARLVHYVPTSVSLENVCIVATK